MADGGEDAGRAALLAARASYSRLVAYLAAAAGDVAAAEDALSDAFRAALETWPDRGVPDKPEAWLLAAARHRLTDMSRHRAVQAQAAATLRLLTEEAADRAAVAPAFPDERLKLLFICAHPAIDIAARTPLMLQTVLGIDAGRIASAFLVSPAAMGQRLVRAKAKIRDARISFDVPEYHQLPERLDAVLDAIYAAYGTGWDDTAGTDSRRRGLADEAVWLARLAVELLPDAAEAHGLLALMLYCEARRPARRTEAGAYMPLSEQDVQLWRRPMIEEAKRALATAAAQHRLGRFQLEAAIQSQHAMRLTGGDINWASIVALYDALAEMSPTIGALIGRAAALAEERGAAAGLAALEAIDMDRARSYQPYWAVRGALLARLDRTDGADAAYERAIGLTEDRAVRAFLLTKMSTIER
ncbi:MAG: RNA polymerase subunit sigma-70 [Alphaproteobacteria bacterium]|nr:RNA polymerase subunit sigma-70 [Alphaproteobacteria bacterium]